MKKKTKERLVRIEKSLQHLTLQVEELKLFMHGDSPGHSDDSSPVTEPQSMEKTVDKAPAKVARKKAK